MYGRYPIQSFYEDWSEINTLKEQVSSMNDDLSEIKNLLKTLLEKINFNEFENIDLNYFKNSNKKEIDKEYSIDIYKNASRVYNDFKEKLILK